MDRYWDLSVERQRDAALLIADYFLAYAETSRRDAYLDRRLRMAAEDSHDAERSADILVTLDMLRPAVLSDNDWRAMDEILKSHNDA